MGIVVRTSDGELIQAKTSRSLGVSSSELAEAMAIKEALSSVKTKNW